MSTAAFGQAIATWHDFYALTAGAAATLLGLLFVAVSLNLALFTYLVLIALVIVGPDPRPTSLGWFLLIISGVELVATQRESGRARRLRGVRPPRPIRPTAAPSAASASAACAARWHAPCTPWHPSLPRTIRSTPAPTGLALVSMRSAPLRLLVGVIERTSAGHPLVSHRCASPGT